MSLFTALACLLLALGFTLLFFGNRLAQWGFSMAAVAGAGIAGALAGQAAHLPDWQTWLLSALAAGTACLLAAFLFRLWMGASTMIYMALLVAAMVVIWQGPPLPQVHAVNPMGQEAQALHQIWQDNAAAVRQWWEHKPEGARRTLELAMAIGGMLGLGLGLAVPLRAAALQCAGAGAGMVLVAARALLELHWPKGLAYFPESPRAILLVFLVALALGFAAQGGENEGEGEDWDKAKDKKPEKK